MSAELSNLRTSIMALMLLHPALVIGGLERALIAVEMTHPLRIVA